MPEQSLGGSPLPGMKNGVYKRPATAYIPPVDLIRLPDLIADEAHGQDIHLQGCNHYQKRLNKMRRKNQRWVELIPEPTNPFDATAVSVEVDLHRIGYLGRSVARKWHDLITSYNISGAGVTTLATLTILDDGGLIDVSVLMPDHELWRHALLESSAHTEAGQSFAALDDQVRGECVEQVWVGLRPVSIQALYDAAPKDNALSWRDAGGRLVAPVPIIEVLRDELTRTRELARSARDALNEKALQDRKLALEAQKSVAAVERHRLKESRAAWRVQQACQARDRQSNGESLSEIAEALKVSVSKVSALLQEERGRRHSGDHGNLNDVAAERRILTAMAALAMSESGKSNSEICARTGHSRQGLKDLLSDARFYRAPNSYPERFDLAAAQNLVNGPVSSAIPSERDAVSLRARSRAQRDAAALQRISSKPSLLLPVDN